MRVGTSHNFTSRAAAAIAGTVPTLHLVFVMISTPISKKGKYIHVHVITLGYILQSIHYGVTSTNRLKSSPRNCCRHRDCRGLPLGKLLNLDSAGLLSLAAWH